jgi:hypothetical protein
MYVRITCMICYTSITALLRMLRKPVASVDCGSRLMRAGVC